MEITGEYRLRAPRQTVWEMLNDTDVLRQCIPGCESLEETGSNTYAAKITAAVGPVKAKFNTELSLTDLNPPQSYTIAGQAKSGAAGFGRGEAAVKLAEDGGETVLTYNAELKVGGKLAQIGSRMVVGATRKTADDFFTRFAELVDPGAIAAQPAAADRAAAPNRIWWAVAGAVLVLLLILLLFR